ncbi:hypothetical protein [Microcoleus sp.]|uniref:hypothetical protein n=1 Tax=Microcoleus sp. TaxID=44472 RepID=UPI00359330E0
MTGAVPGAARAIGAKIKTLTVSCGGSFPCRILLPRNEGKKSGFFEKLSLIAKYFGTETEFLTPHL